MIMRHVFTVFLILLMGTMAVGAFAYAGTAAFGFPFTVASIVCVMGFAPLVAEWRADRAAKASGVENDGGGVRQKAPPPIPPGKAKPVDLVGLATIYAFLIGFLVVAHFLSFLVAVPVFLFLMCLLFSKEGWLASAVLAGTVGLFVFLVFGLVLNTF